MYLAASFCQPFLISALLEYLDKSSSNRNRAHGFGLIAATVLTYGAIAISTALYRYLQERFIAMIRGCLVGPVYEKTTATSISSMENFGAITLMSTDVERVQRKILDLHEYWANYIQVALACWWLKRQLRPSFAAPIVVIVFSIFASSYTGRLMGPRQRAWMQAIRNVST
jgi:ATP-binding cassette, subfamily C (CFTR/MRP), member 1